MSTQLGLESKAVFSRFLSSIWLSHLMGNKSWQGLFWFPVSAPMRFSRTFNSFAFAMRPDQCQENTSAWWDMNTSEVEGLGSNGNDGVVLQDSIDALWQGHGQKCTASIELRW